MLSGNISMGLVFKYYYSGDVALKRNFDKRTIKWEEVKKKELFWTIQVHFLKKMVELV